MNGCCALCGTFSCDCGPDAPCMKELLNPKHIPIEDYSKGFVIPKEFILNEIPKREIDG